MLIMIPMRFVIKNIGYNIIYQLNILHYINIILNIIIKFEYYNTMEFGDGQDIIYICNINTVYNDKQF